jgi:hypothetical protein
MKGEKKNTYLDEFGVRKPLVESTPQSCEEPRPNNQV